MNNQNKDFQQKLNAQVNNQKSVDATDYANAAEFNNSLDQAQSKKKSKKNNNQAQFNNSNSTNQTN